MANVTYPKFKETLLKKVHDLTADSVRASLIDTSDYTFAATDETYVAGANGVPDAAKVAMIPLASPTVALGVFDTADFTWIAVAGDTCEAVILWNDTPTTPIADPLMAYYDAGMTGIPVTPNGGNINCTVHTSGWFAL